LNCKTPMPNLKEIPQKLLPTLANAEWVKDNEDKLRDLFPETWTHPLNVDHLNLRYKTKLIGLEWSTDAELTSILVTLTKMGIAQVSPQELIRRNPHSIFSRSK